MMKNKFDKGGAFKKLVAQLVKKGKSMNAAQKIAYSIGAKKYGKAGMAAKAAAGRTA